MKTNIIPSLLLMLAMTVAPLRLLAMSERIQKRAETKNQEASQRIQRSQAMAAGAAKSERREEPAYIPSEFKGDEGDDSASSEENSEEGKTTAESGSRRSSGVSDRDEKSFLDTPWNRALQSLQQEETEWHSISQSMQKKASLSEVDSSLLRAASIFQALENQGYLEQAMRHIDFATHQYVQARELYFSQDSSQSEYCEKAAQAAKQSAVQYIIAAESLLEAKQAEQEGNEEIATRWREVAGEFETAGRFYRQEAEAYQLEDKNEWKRWHRLSSTTQHAAEQRKNIISYLEKIKDSSSRGLDSSIVEYLNKAQKRTEAAVSYYTQALEANAQGDHSNWLRFAKSAQAAENSAQQFEKASSYLQQAAKVTSYSPGSASEVRLIQAVEKAISAAELYFQEEEACLQNNQEVDNLQKNALKAKNKAKEYFQEAERLRASEKIASDPAIMDAFSTEIAHQSRIKSASVEKNKRFELAVKHYQLALAHNAEAEKHRTTATDLADLHGHTSEQFKIAGDHFTASAEKLAQGQQTETTFHEAAELAAESASLFKKAIDHWEEKRRATEEADEQGVQLANQLFEATHTAAESYARAAEFRKERDPRKASMMEQVGKALAGHYKDLDEAMRQAQETKGNQKVAHTWHAIAEKCELAIKHWSRVYDSYSSMEEEKKEQAEKSKHSASVIEERIKALREYLETVSLPKQPPEIIYSREEADSQSSNTRRIELIKSEGRYPYTRYEKEFDSNRNKIGEAVMVADHLMVRLTDQLPETQKQFLQDLDHPGAWLESVLPSEPLFLLHFLPRGSVITTETAQGVIDAMPQLLEKIKTNRSAVHAEPNFFLEALSEPNDPYYGEQWNLKGKYGINPPDGLFSGVIPNPETPIIIALIDSGINRHHEDLRENIWSTKDKDGDSSYGYNGLAEECDQLKYDPVDEAGHGTAIAGIIGAVPNNGIGIAGIAGIPGMVKLMGCKSMERKENGTPEGRWMIITSAAIKSIDFARQNGAKILNCSWGTQQQSSEFPNGFLREKVTELRNALSNDHKPLDQHVAVVCAAGNKKKEDPERLKTDPNYGNNDFYLLYPASYELENLVSVAASKPQGNIHPESYHGKERVHIAAPGSHIWSTTHESDLSYGNMRFGTSFAAPHVTAALALMMIKFPNLSIRDLIDKLLLASHSTPLIKLPKSTGTESIAHGRLNLAACLELPPMNFVAASEPEEKAVGGGGPEQGNILLMSPSALIASFTQLPSWSKKTEVGGGGPSESKGDDSESEVTSEAQADSKVTSGAENKNSQDETSDLDKG